ncbi:hypothetical protein Ahy_B10g100861 [Arachis hypogaea]|uniref:SCP domain-containing protein n=1 Tax=Arachis hypogaea TaxID=3818 RepID=A0A444WXY4_ARAHY|nr:hypothetical protein Ahy_B10g100861 [Arachis hypogaea]
MKRLLKISMIVISLVSIIPLCSPSQSFPEDYLEGHNVARAKVGVKPLKWDKELESHAHKFVNEHIANCKGIMSMSHSSNSMYGQNSGYNPYHASAASAVKAWVAQERNYDPISNKCIDGNPASCHCYVQVVWGASTYLGCARGDCHNNEGTLTQRVRRSVSIYDLVRHTYENNTLVCPLYVANDDVEREKPPAWGGVAQLTRCETTGRRKLHDDAAGIRGARELWTTAAGVCGDAAPERGRDLARR